MSLFISLNIELEFYFIYDVCCVKLVCTEGKKTCVFTRE